MMSFMSRMTLWYVHHRCVTLMNFSMMTMMSVLMTDGTEKKLGPLMLLKSSKWYSMMLSDLMMVED